MSALCRLGWHDWTRWEPLNIRTKHIVHDTIGKRRPEEDFITTERVLTRTCKRCGLEERRA